MDKIIMDETIKFKISKEKKQKVFELSRTNRIQRI